MRTYKQILTEEAGGHVADWISWANKKSGEGSSIKGNLKKLGLDGNATPQELVAALKAHDEVDDPSVWRVSVSPEGPGTMYFSKTGRGPSFYWVSRSFGEELKSLAGA